MAGPHDSTTVLKAESGKLDIKRHSLEYSVYIISPVWVGRLILQILEEPLLYLEAHVIKHNFLNMYMANLCFGGLMTQSTIV